MARYRRKMKKKRSKRLFRRTAGSRSVNRRNKPTVMRGGGRM